MAEFMRELYKKRLNPVTKMIQPAFRELEQLPGKMI